MIGRLTTIASKEALDVTPETMKALVDVSNGDMRKSITMLQSARRLLSPGERLSPGHVTEIAGVIPANVVQFLLSACKANSFKSLQDAANDTIAEGFPVDQILTQILNAITNDESITDIQKSLICIRIAEADHKLTEGADEYLQLMDVLSVIATTILEEASN